MKKYLLLIFFISCQPKSPQIIISSEKIDSINIPIKEYCEKDQIHIQGLYCTNLKQTCLEWLDKKRCKSFAHNSECLGEEVLLDFCIDKEEAHDSDNMPLNNITWNQANKLCKDENKRLCNENEWTLACEGPNRLPYPYGYERNENICNIDHKAYIKNKKLVNESVSINEYPECLSPYGVHNMVGNIDESTVSMSPTQYKSIFKGGFWGYIRAACRPKTTEHFENYSDIQTGFRCCSNSR